jgi:hypothetical protein
MLALGPMRRQPLQPADSIHFAECENTVILYNQRLTNLSAAKEKRMTDTFMILPARDANSIRLVRIPADMERHEAFRHATGLIASIEEANPEYRWDDIAASLEDHGFEPVEFILGPALD